MSEFGVVSSRRLATCHPDIQRVLRAVVIQRDCAVSCGHRNEAMQNEAVLNGTSRLLWPNSNHNEIPSKAVDVIPWPLDWKDIASFHVLGGLVLGTAWQMDIRMRWGGDWDGDWDLRDQDLIDLPHFELLPSLTT